MKTSTTISALAKALSAAQAEMPAVAFDSTNPFLHNRYASLGAVIEASRPVLAKHRLAVTQFPANDGETIGVETILAHESGEFISERLSIALGEEKGKSRAQVAGSIITYLRRYAWASVLGLYADEDTDGNAPESRQNAPRQAGAVPRSKATPAAASQASAPAAASTPPKQEPTRRVPTPETRKWMIAQIGPELTEMARDYFVQLGQLMDNERLEELPLRFVPTNKADMEKLKDAIVNFGNGDQATAAFPANPDAPLQDKNSAAANTPADGEPPVDDGLPPEGHFDSPNAPWRSFKVPFGGSAGTTLAELDKKKLFGFWANFKVEDTYQGKPRSPQKIAADKIFRAMLDEAGKHYKFTPPEDVTP